MPALRPTPPPAPSGPPAIDGPAQTPPASIPLAKPLPTDGWQEIVDAAWGVAIALPPHWAVLTAADLDDEAAIAAAEGEAGVNLHMIGEFVTTMRRDPTYRVNATAPDDLLHAVSLREDTGGLARYAGSFRAYVDDQRAEWERQGTPIRDEAWLPLDRGREAVRYRVLGAGYWYLLPGQRDVWWLFAVGVAERAVPQWELLDTIATTFREVDGSGPIARAGAPGT